MQIGLALGSFSERNRFEFWLIYHTRFPKTKRAGQDTSCTQHGRTLPTDFSQCWTGVWKRRWAGGSCPCLIAPSLGAQGQRALWTLGESWSETTGQGRESEWPGWHSPLNRHLPAPAVPSLGWLIHPGVIQVLTCLFWNNFQRAWVLCQPLSFMAPLSASWARPTKTASHHPQFSSPFSISFLSASADHGSPRSSSAQGTEFKLQK